LRYTVGVFNWQNDCFYCCNPAKVDTRHPESADSIRHVETLSLRQDILEICDGRNDQWSTDVKGRLQNYNDLVAVEAVYHRTCINNFRRGFACPGSVCVTDPSASAFRPDCGQKMAAFEQLCAWLESSAEPNTYSLEELRNHMIAAGNSSEEVYSEKQLQRLLEKHYGKDRVFISQQAGRRNIVCFRDMASFIVHKQWEEARSSDISTESHRIVETAAKLIRAELKEQKYDMDSYPSLYDVKNIDVCRKFVPPLLQTLFQTLVTNDLKQVAIGNCVVQAARPRSVITPVLYGVGVETDNVFGSRCW
jgi:hypothetical protein